MLARPSRPRTVCIGAFSKKKIATEKGFSTMRLTLCSLFVSLAISSVAFAQADPAPAAQPAATPAAPPAPPTWSIGPIDFSGLVDGYYTFNFNHPASQYNQLYNFDVKANQFSLNMAKLTLAHTA